MSEYIPRAGTKARAVYDLLEDGREHRWRECFEAYHLGGDGPSNPDYVSLGLGRVLERVATRVRRGVYVKRLADLKPEIKNPCAEIPLPPVNEYPHGRKFKPGDRIRYDGGYSHFQSYHVPIGSVFTVDFYGTTDGWANSGRRVDDCKGFVFLEEDPGGGALKGGHGEHYFELVSSSDPAIVHMLDETEDLAVKIAEKDESISVLNSEVNRLMEAGEKIRDDLVEARSQCDVLQAELLLKDERIKALQDKLTETAVKINHLENGNVQLERSLDCHQEGIRDLEQDLESRDVVIKNQLDWIRRLEGQTEAQESRRSEIRELAIKIKAITEE